MNDFYLLNVSFYVVSFLMGSNPEYKDTPMDIAQLPNLPEKASESSETSDSESDSKENSGSVPFHCKYDTISHKTFQNKWKVAGLIYTWSKP